MNGVGDGDLAFDTNLGSLLFFLRDFSHDGRNIRIVHNIPLALGLRTLFGIIWGLFIIFIVRLIYPSEWC